MMSCLYVTGAASAALLLRVVNLVMQHDLPLYSVTAEFGDDTSNICLRFEGRPDRPVHVLVERLRSLVEVGAVEWCEEV